MMSVGSSWIGTSSGKSFRRLPVPLYRRRRIRDTHDPVVDTTTVLVAKFGGSTSEGIDGHVAAEA